MFTLGLLCVLCIPVRTTGQTTRNILFVFSSQDQQRRDLDSFKKALQAQFHEHLIFHSSYVDYERMRNVEYRDSLAETFRYAYKDVKMDIAIVSAEEALGFVLQYRDKILPGVPIVFYSLSAAELMTLGTTLPSGVTGRTASVGLRQTIDLALRLHPEAQSVAIVTEKPNFWWRAARSEMDRHRDRVKSIDVFGPPGADVLHQIAALPPHTIILFQLATLSAKDTDIKPNDVLAIAARDRPTYCAWKASFILGCIGGAYIDGEQYIAETAAIAGRVLAGERPEDIPIVEDSNFVAEVDWRQLQRWHIAESALPSGAVVLNRQPSVWERGRKYILPAIFVILAQAFLIAALLWQRARNRKAEAVLRESEQRFRVMADTTPSLVWMCNARGTITYLNKRRLEFTDPKQGMRQYDSWIASVHPDDLESMQANLAQALQTRKPFSQEYRLRRGDGAYRWMYDVASPRVSGDKSFAGFIGSAIDTTEQKLAQQSLAKMGGQLIEAQERERERIARELHDDICQRLALLSLEIEGVHGESVVQDANTAKNLEHIGKLCGEIATDVQGLSHQLHSSILDYLGVAAALDGFCNELSRQYDLHIQFDARDVPKQLPKDISLCLFRVAQEALHNAVKYSGVSQLAVKLVGIKDVIQLTVIDAGVGFNPEEARQLGGLGLVSMQERVHLVQGTLSVESKTGEGTRILVTVPRAGYVGNTAAIQPPSQEIVGT